MELRKDLKTTLTAREIGSFARLFATEKDYSRIMGDLCTIREYMANLFVYEGTPLQGNEEHPVFKIACTLNEIIGSLLKPNYHLYTNPTQYGKTISLINFSIMEGKR